MSRHRDIKVGAQFVHGEGFTDSIYFAKLVQQFPQTTRLNSVDLQVPVFRLPAHEFVAHTAPNQQRATTCGAHRLGQVSYCVWKARHFCPMSNVQCLMSKE